MLIPGPKFNPNRLLKREMLWLWTHHCKAHGHTYASHPNCYFKEKPYFESAEAPGVERVGFCDIEATSLNASFGYMFSYCIKELDGGILEGQISPADIRSYRFDYNIMKKLCVDIRKFDRIIVYYGKDYRYDIPFIRTRAVLHGLDFPTYKELIVNDLFDIVKKKLKLHRNRLETACNFFGISCKGHRLDPNVWQKAQAGDQAALDWILEHNREDVISTELLWKKLHEYIRSPNTSI
jgi:uncharacterized protein YprB with RNaseH-like and TPR domain